MNDPTPAVQLHEVCVDYDGTRAVDAVSVTVPPRGIHVLLGRSGSGKTSILRAIAGFEPISSGSIRIAGAVVDDAASSTWIPPEQRGIGFVFQDYALFGHLDAVGNVGFGIAGDKTQKAQGASTWLQRVQLGEHGARRPHELSGGEQQRVALARALARKPALVLLDEPFSNLDPDLRREVRQQTVSLLRSTDSAAIFVTHDVEEAFSIADTICVMDHGKLAQVGTPRDLYERPASRYVARLCGPASFLEITNTSNGRATCALGDIAVVAGANVGDFLALRPEHLVVSTGSEYRIVARRFLGYCEELDVELDGVTLTCRTDFGAVDPDVSTVCIALRGTAATITTTAPMG